MSERNMLLDMHVSFCPMCFSGVGYSIQNFFLLVDLVFTNEDENLNLHSIVSLDQHLLAIPIRKIVLMHPGSTIFHSNTLYQHQIFLALQFTANFDISFTVSLVEGNLFNIHLVIIIKVWETIFKSKCEFHILYMKANVKCQLDSVRILF